MLKPTLPAFHLINSFLCIYCMPSTVLGPQGKIAAPTPTPGALRSNRGKQTTNKEVNKYSNKIISKHDQCCTENKPGKMIVAKGLPYMSGQGKLLGGGEKDPRESIPRRGNSRCKGLKVRMERFVREQFSKWGPPTGNITWELVKNVNSGAPACLSWKSM